MRPNDSNYQSTNPQAQSPSNPTTSGLVCRYCKLPGHSPENSRKREYNKIRNQRFPSNNNQSPQRFRKVNFTQEQDDGRHDEIDIDNANNFKSMFDLIPKDCMEFNETLKGNESLTEDVEGYDCNADLDVFFRITVFNTFSDKKQCFIMNFFLGSVLRNKNNNYITTKVHLTNG